MSVCNICVDAKVAKRCLPQTDQQPAKSGTIAVISVLLRLVGGLNGIIKISNCCECCMPSEL